MLVSLPGLAKLSEKNACLRLIYGYRVTFGKQIPILAGWRRRPFGCR